VSPDTALQLILVTPLFGALIVVLLGRDANVRDSATVVISLALLGLVVGYLLPAVQAGERPAFVLTEMLPGVRIAFEVEPLGMVFALVATGLWWITSIYGFGYMRGHHEKNQTRFFACFALAIFGALGVAFAANVLTLFVFYEVITLSTYPLVTHHGTPEAKRSGRIYLGLLMGTSIAFLLLAVVWTQFLAGTTDFRPGGILDGKASDGMLTVLLGLYAFGAGKAALMPFHRWLPAAMVAPTPVSAMLHAVCVVKAGVFTVIKVLVYVFGVDLLRDTGISAWLCWVAVFTIVSASLVALTKDNLKARLAYSTISQLAYIVLGAALATDFAVLGGGMHIAMHACGKITLFFCAGAVMVGAHKTEISQMTGLGRRMPFTFFAFLIGSLSIIGVPPLGGSWSKWYLALGAAEADQRIFVGVLMLSSLLSIGYLMPVVGRAFFLPEPAHDEHGGHDDHGDHHDHGEAPLLCYLPPLVTAASCVALFFFAGDLMDLLEGVRLR
jgi:multicomponent Na+:H+ antiporter subunit D